MRLGFAIAAHLEPEILVVDEVLAVGDAEFQKKAIGKMQDVSKPIVLVDGERISTLQSWSIRKRLSSIQLLVRNFTFIL